MDEVKLPIKESKQLEVYKDKGYFKHLGVKNFLDQFMPNGPKNKTFVTYEDLIREVVHPLNWLHFGSTKVIENNPHYAVHFTEKYA